MQLPWLAHSEVMRAFREQVGWHRLSWVEFFRTGKADHPPDRAAPLNVPVMDTSAASQRTGWPVHKHSDPSASDPSDGAISAASSAGLPVPPAPLVQPLYISKLNTVFQLALIAGCIGKSWFGWPTQDLLIAGGCITGLTTLASFAAYVHVYRQGKLTSGQSSRRGAV
jgi:cardiolipin synthase